MVLPRGSSSWASVLRNCSARRGRGGNWSRAWHHVQRRAYASEGGHGSQQAKSDLPWAIGAIVVTVPSCAYLLQPSPSKGHGSGEHDHAEHDEHETDGDDESEEGSAGEEEGAEKQEEVDKSDEQPESSGDDGTLSSGESDDSASETGEQQDTPDTSDDEKPGNEAYETEGGGNVEGVRFKGATKGGTKEGEQGDTRKHIPDAKGANKKRIESHYGMQQGVAEDDEDQATMDKAAASKPAGSQSTQSGKQEGLSNTDTKHSTDITNNPEKSKKGEGTPETSKSKGTVDPARPQAETAS